MPHLRLFAAYTPVVHHLNKCPSRTSRISIVESKKHLEQREGLPSTAPRQKAGCGTRLIHKIESGDTIAVDAGCIHGAV